ncbi:MAG: alpha/beta hydrolase [Clostridiaceae bacterium]|jgi:pimeloyl-ACP methyl ester carboxylesterase|nr:alpha/beta hydrolase [Clostridiaceae bacterium]
MFSIINSGISIRGLKKNQFAGFMEGIKKLDIPVLILYGKNDKILSYKNSILLHRVLKNSQCVAVENCGHELQVESCDIFCEKTIGFLKQI